MVNQYPDTLSYENVAGELTSLNCRFVPARGTTFHKRQDGTELIYKFSIAFPFGTKNIPSGTIIVFLSNNNFLA